jgi:hypothetical protein
MLSAAGEKGFGDLRIDADHPILISMAEAFFCFLL